MVFEDSEVINIIKVEDSVYILGKCKEKDEACSLSLMCCSENPYCWGSSFVCHESCASLGENAADDKACCSGFLNVTTGKCDEPPFCPVDRICNGASESTVIGGKDCCPVDKPVCIVKHCCPVDKPRWCERPVDDNPRCMSEADYKDKSKCKTALFKLIVIPIDWSDLEKFKQIAESNADWFISISPFSNCPDVVEKVIPNTKNCGSSSVSAILRCARNWGLIPDDDPTGNHWRITGLGEDQGWSGGIGGYVSCSGGLNDPLCKVNWATVAWGRMQGREGQTPPYPHELGHNFGLCGEYCGSGTCDGPVYYCSDKTKCPSSCSEINKPPSDPVDPNCVMNNKGAIYYHQPCTNWLWDKALPYPIKYYCGG
jgi:hypothetical protein